MLYFPQLLTGTTVQYPFSKRQIQRTVRSGSPDGHAFKLLDPGGASIEWELTFQTMSNEERIQLESFFGTVEGKLEEFTFLDPTDNLLLWSEDLTATAWTRGPLLTLTGGVADPDGGSNATRISNSGAALQTVQQTISGPGWFQYCCSLYARSEQAANLTIFRAIAGMQETRRCPLTSSWTRVVHAGQSQNSEESVTFGIALETGAAVEVYGIQAEAQPAPSAYRKTSSRCGVHKTARFDDDSLPVISEGPEQHSCKVRIVAPATS